jgi:acyl-coenzyme A thioesterase PaaI-like protein
MNDPKNIQERSADSFKSQGLMATLGAQIVSVTEGEVQIVLSFSAKLSQQHGYLHAGAITTSLTVRAGMLP